MGLATVGNQRMVYHWNGSDWKSFAELQGLPVFIVGSDGLKTYVVHGR
jgi:hypothetical protein